MDVNVAGISHDPYAIYSYLMNHKYIFAWNHKMHKPNDDSN